MQGSFENGYVGAIPAGSGAINPFIISVSEGGTGADNAADARANLGVISLSDFAIVSGTITSSNPSYVSYPSGFNETNTFVIGYSIEMSSTDYHQCYFAFVTNSNGIAIINNAGSPSAYYNKPIRVMIMKAVN